MSRRPRGRCRFPADGAQVYNKGISFLRKWYSSASCYQARPGAARPGGTGAAATPRKGTWDSGEGSLPSRTRLPRAGRFAASPAKSLQHGPSEGGSGLPDSAGVPWLLDSCSAILIKAAQNKKNCVRQQCSARAHCSRSECQLRPARWSSTVRVRHRQCASNLHPAPAVHAWGHLTLITPNQDDFDVARSRWRD